MERADVGGGVNLPVGLLNELEHSNQNMNVKFISEPLILEAGEDQNTQAQIHGKTAERAVTKKRSVNCFRLR